ncbi:Uncharacterised protein [Mycobacterium tuberculosis]|nr:Uncharacterised protein [Mycobacterium tuberculosis]
MGGELAEIVRLFLILGTVCLFFGAIAGYALGPGLVYRTRRLLRRLRR